MSVPCFKVRWDPRPRPAGGGILPPSARTWKRREREDPREWDFTYHCNQWMECEWMWACQSSKASGKSRPGACLRSLAGSKGGDHPVVVDLPSGVSAPECKGECREKEREPGSQARKGKFIRGKREGDGPLRRTSVLPF